MGNKNMHAENLQQKIKKWRGEIKVKKKMIERLELMVSASNEIWEIENDMTDDEKYALLVKLGGFYG